MLISHAKKFIYTKTVKTAGTSVESYFERHCMRDGEWVFSHGRAESVSDAGIIGVRSGEPLDIQAATWWNHMPAKTIKSLIGDATWNGYFKFCVVRNPFDKMVSAFRFFSTPPKPKSTVDGVISWLGGFGGPKKSDNVKFAFENWLKTVPMPLDQNKYVIDGTFCMDHVIKYESLVEGIREVCQQLGLEFDAKSLPHLKKSEESPVPLEGYYSKASIEMVERAYGFELEKFGYSFPKALRRAA